MKREGFGDGIEVPREVPWSPGFDCLRQYEYVGSNVGRAVNVDFAGEAVDPSLIVRIASWMVVGKKTFCFLPSAGVLRISVRSEGFSGVASDPAARDARESDVSLQNSHWGSGLWRTKCTFVAK